VVAAVDGEFTVKELCTRPKLQLLPRNKAYSPIQLNDGDELNIFGVVTNVIRQMKRK
jgi:DNA polymerase V